MQAREVLRSLTFRYIVKYVTALSGSVFILLGAYYVYFSYTSFVELGDSVRDELQNLRGVYGREGLPGVERFIAQRNTGPAVHRFFYLVTNPAGEKLAGNLPSEPRYSEFDDGWLGFQLAVQDWDGAVDVDFLARPVELGDGYRAIVARDYVNIVERGRLVFSTLVRVMLATVLLGVTGGFFSAARALDRVEKLNREISRIIRSDPGQRLAVEEEEGYARALANVVNQMLEQMETLMAGVRRVSDNIAHDLRTPLTRIRNELSQLRTRQSGADREYMEHIIGECDELLAAFNASLRISTLESGSRLAGGSDVDLRSLLLDVVELYEPLAQEREIELDLDAEGELVCRGEADLLFQMFANILDNAVKYTPRGGRIDVQLRPPEGAAEFLSVLICDSGPGIPLHERQNVFRRFYRVESSRSGKPGHGLGLSLVQAIARYHHGSVELGSNNPGLQVRVKLPAAAPQRAKPQSSSDR